MVSAYQFANRKEPPPSWKVILLGTTHGRQTIGYRADDYKNTSLGGSKLAGQLTVLPGRGFLVDAGEEYKR